MRSEKRQKSPTKKKEKKMRTETKFTHSEKGRNNKEDGGSTQEVGDTGSEPMVKPRKGNFSEGEIKDLWALWKIFPRTDH